MMQLYKVLGADGRAFHGGRGQWTPGRWRSARGPLVPCANGLHVTTIAQLPQWLGPAIWRAETDGELLDAGDTWVARRARITEQVTAWDERTARLFAADCAEHVCPIFERTRPGDTRPREAIATARRYAVGEATDEECDAALTVTAAAIRDAVQAAAWDATLAVARAAARAAAWNAAWDAVRYAVSAAWYAALDAARAAAWEAEKTWQAQHLAELLGLPWGVEP
jgi:hypothetical protein